MIGLSHRATWETTGKPSKKVTWKTYAKDLIHFLDKHDNTNPVIGAGHSMGAVATLIAATLQPETVQSSGSDRSGISVQVDIKHAQLVSQPLEIPYSNDSQSTEPPLSMALNGSMC